MTIGDGLRAGCATLLGLAACVAMAQPVDEFDWVATLRTPAAGGAVRATLPAQALMRLRSARADDVRVFDAQGRAVAFAFAAPPGQAAPPRVPTAVLPALALHGQAGASRDGGARVQVRIDDGSGGPRTVWVQMAPDASVTGSPGIPASTTASRSTAASSATPAPPAAAPRPPAHPPALPAALFDARRVTQTISAIVVDARLPANTPVGVTLWSSTDLAQWSPVTLRARLYRFEGDNAPANDTLELDRPLALEGRYLRLDWQGHDGVSAISLRGLVAPTAAVARVSAPLPPAQRDGDQALQWELRFGPPLAALSLAAPPGELLPVRVLGRNQPSEPWRPLTQGLLYRPASGGENSGANGGARTPPAELTLPRIGMRWLRVEATHGQHFGPQGLEAAALFDPVDVVFVAAGAGPYRLAVGRPDTPPAHLPLSMLASVVPQRLDDLPAAAITDVGVRPEAPPSVWQRLLPAGLDARTAALWGVLLLAVVVLGAAAWALFSQLGARSDDKGQQGRQVPGDAPSE